MEIGRADGRARELGAVFRDVDDRDRTLRVVRETRAAVIERLALVRDDDVGAIGGERQHVGEGARRERGEDATRKVEEDHLARLLPVLGLDRRGGEVTPGGDAVDAAAVGREVDREERHRMGRVGEVERLHGVCLCVDEEEPLRRPAVGGDLRPTLLEQPGRVAADLLQPDLAGGKVDGRPVAARAVDIERYAPGGRGHGAEHPSQHLHLAHESPLLVRGAR